MLRTSLFALTTAAALTLLSGAANAQYYANPTIAETQQARQTGPCQDPWVSIAIKNMMGRTAQGAGAYGECNVMMYNGGQWADYNTLAHAVRLALGNLSSAGVGFSLARNSDRATLTLKDGGAAIDSMVLKLIGTDSAGVISDWGAGLISVNHSRVNYSIQNVGNEKRINLGKSVLVIRKR